MTDNGEFTPGYHLTRITKGILGTSSKIQEELDELKDAESQDNKILVLCELADIVGAIDSYLCLRYNNITLKDLQIMSDATKRAFMNGQRK